VGQIGLGLPVFALSATPSRRVALRAGENGVTRVKMKNSMNIEQHTFSHLQLHREAAEIAASPEIFFALATEEFAKVSPVS